MRPFKLKEPINLLSVTSTNDVIKDLSSLEEGIIVTSMIQTEGRGRNGRRWFSDSGGLYFSLLLKPTFDTCLNEKIAQLTGKILFNVIESYLVSKEIQFKEPNDILVDGKKIAGILIEGKIEERKNLYLIVGVGVNISNDVPYFSTSLKNEGVKILDNKEFLDKFISSFEKIYNEWLNALP